MNREGCIVIATESLAGPLRVAVALHPPQPVASSKQSQDASIAFQSQVRGLDTPV